MFGIQYYFQQMSFNYFSKLVAITFTNSYLCSISYAVVGIVCSGTTKREASGSVQDLVNGTYLDCATKNCAYGSYNDYQVNLITKI